MKKLHLVIISAILSGCAVPTSGVIPRGNDLYTVTHQGETAFHSTEPLKTAATKEASEYCAKIGKKFVFLHSKEVQGRPAQYPESEVLFKCE